jgi:hypothetical protein
MIQANGAVSKWSLLDNPIHLYKFIYAAELLLSENYGHGTNR